MIEGNITAMLQIKVTSKDIIGSAIKDWKTVAELTGWLDYQSGDSKYTSFNAKIQESTHIFVSDFQQIPDTFSFEGKSYKVNTENVRMVVNSQEYDVILIDDPMNLHKQLEIYLKYTGGQ